MREELPVLDHQIDARDVHVHDAAGANVEVSNLAVPHLTFGQSDEWTASMNQRVGIVAQQPVIRRLARERNGVGLGFRAITPAVENSKNQRFGTRQNWLLLRFVNCRNRATRSVRPNSAKKYGRTLSQECFLLDSARPVSG